MGVSMPVIVVDEIDQELIIIDGENQERYPLDDRQDLELRVIEQTIQTIQHHQNLWLEELGNAKPDELLCVEMCAEELLTIADATLEHLQELYDMLLEEMMEANESEGSTDRLTYQDLSDQLMEAVIADGEREQQEYDDRRFGQLSEEEGSCYDEELIEMMRHERGGVLALV
jgi:hypothetical protein